MDDSAVPLAALIVSYWAARLVQATIERIFSPALASWAGAGH